MSYIEDNLPPAEAWPDFINSERVTARIPYNCAAELLDKAVEEGFGERVAIHTPQGSLTYRELLALSNRIANLLTLDMGLRAGEPVLLRSANNAMLAASWLAVVKAGGIAVSTAAILRARELSTMAEIGQVNLAICDQRLEAELARAAEDSGFLHKRLLFTDTMGKDERISSHSDRYKNHLDDGTPIAILAFTSGTTGKPKGAVHSHHAILAICETYAKDVMRRSDRDIFTGTPPLAFVYGLGGLLVLPLYFRAATLLLEDVRPGPLTEAIKSFGATVIFTAPTAYKTLLNTQDPRDLATLEFCASAGEPLPNFVAENWWAKTGNRLMDGIGSTEMLHVFCSVQSDQDPRGSLGRAVPGYEVKVVDEQGGEVADDTTGYLAVRGPTGCRYLNDERQADYVRNGWNITGDTAKRDAQGCIWFQGRSDSMIISAGYNIAGPDVEQVIARHPAVAECAVIGAPDPDRGQVVMAWVVLRENESGDDAMVASIQSFVKEQAAPYKYPRKIVFIDALPRTPTGKVQHFVLRERERISDD